MPSSRLAALPLLALLACATPPKVPEVPPPALIDTTWSLVAIRAPGGREVLPDDPARYTLRLGAAGQAEIRADCNRASGGYTLDGQGLSFSAFAVTRAACAAGSLSAPYLQQLALVRVWGYKGQHLVLVSLLDDTQLEFR